MSECWATLPCAMGAFDRSGQDGICVPVKEATRRIGIDERTIGQPLHGAAPGAGIPEGVPGRQQVRVLLMELIFEPAEGPLALDSPRQPPPGSLICDSVGKVSHILIPDPGRQRIDDNQVQLIEVGRRLPVDAGTGRPEHDLSGARVDQPVVLIVGLVSQRVADLLQIDAAQIKHHARINPACAPGSERATSGMSVCWWPHDDGGPVAVLTVVG